MLPVELIKRVRQIEIRTRRVVDEITAGAYHSVFKGRGIEFDEVREYTTDDDVRDIDWNVTARMGSPYIKQYVEERELTVIFAVDVSASGSFGSADSEKREKAIELAALMAFSAIRNQDKVGTIFFSDRIEFHLSPRSGRKHGLRLVREMLAREPESPGTDISLCLDHLMHTVPRRAVVFLISDFLDDKDFSRSMRIANRRHDVIAVRILDPHEEEWPKTGPVYVEDSETGEQLLFPGTEGRIRAYSESASEIHGRNERICRRAGVDMIDIRCGEDTLKPVAEFFRKRSSRKNR